MSRMRSKTIDIAIGLVILGVIACCVAAIVTHCQRHALRLMAQDTRTVSVAVW